jgi:hypothetical protein
MPNFPTLKARARGRGGDRRPIRSVCGRYSRMAIRLLFSHLPYHPKGAVHIICYGFCYCLTILLMPKSAKAIFALSK